MRTCASCREGHKVKIHCNFQPNKTAQVLWCFWDFQTCLNRCCINLIGIFMEIAAICNI